MTVPEVAILGDHDPALAVRQLGNVHIRCARGCGSLFLAEGAFGGGRTGRRRARGAAR
jgi:hypothetical protein